MQNALTAKLEEKASGKTPDVIHIIGKGPSLDTIDLEQLPPGLVINLNDSERIRPGDIGVFSANWVRHSLQDAGFRCGYYLAGKPLPPDVQHTLLPPIPLELDQEELVVVRLERDEFFDEPFVLLNALKIADRIARSRARPQTVNLLGFDFSLSGGSLSRKAGEDRSGAALGERDAIISAQENDFKQFLHYFASGERLRLIHVGDKSYSAVSTADFARRISGVGTSVRPGPVDLASPERVLIVAELTNNHLGDPERLVEMVERATAAGADLIKVQKRDVDSFYTPDQLKSYYWSPFGETLGDYRRGVELNDELLDLLDATCRRCGIEWFCSVLDLPSYEAIRRFDPRLLKIPSTISNHRDYHKRIAEVYKGAIVVSTGYTESEYVDHVLRTYAGCSQIYLMHCVSAYPTPRQACNVGVVRHYDAMRRKDERIIPGYSSHDLGSLGCVLAVGAGALMLEKHVKLGDVDWVHFDKVALDLRGDGFASFVTDIRQAEEAMGDGIKRVLDIEHHKYTVAAGTK